MDKRDDTLDIDRSQLMYEYHRLDCEFEIVRCLAEELKKHKRYVSAEAVEEAEKYLRNAVFSIQRGLKWVESVSNHEQTQMDFGNN